MVATNLFSKYSHLPPGGGKMRDPENEVELQPKPSIVNLFVNEILTLPL